MIYSLVGLADALGIKSIWGEATRNSVPFYEKVLNLPKVTDHFFVEREPIVQLCLAGTSTDVVARRFRITRERVRQILSRNARDRESAQRADLLAEEFRMADDLDRTWPVEDLLDALALPTPTRRALESHWAGDAVRLNRITLREFMNLVVEPKREGRDYLVIPALKIRGVGGFGFRAFLNGIERLKLGGLCRKEWVERFDLEAHAWRIQGGADYYWSMPNPMRIQLTPRLS